MVTNEEFSRMVEKARYLLRINQKEIASRLGISESYLSGMKKGERNVTCEVADKLSALMNDIKENEAKDVPQLTESKNSETKDRLISFLEYKGLSQKKFEVATGMSNGFVNKIGYNINETSLKKIGEVFPELNIAWLKAGVGSMLIAGDSEGTLETSAGTEDEEVGEEVVTANLIPLLPVSAQGGSLNDFVVSVKGSECEKVISPVKGAEFAMPVAGDSMSPEYPNGSMVFIKRINERAFIEWGKAYVLDTCNGTVIKLLTPSSKGDGYIRCISINQDPIFAPFEVCLSDVFGVYKVLLCMSVK